MEKKIKHPTRGTSLPFRTRNLDARVRRRIMSRFVHDPEIYTTVCRTEMAARLNIEKVPNQESSLLVVYSTSEPHL